MKALFAPGAKRTRIPVIAGLILLLAAPAVLLWASRVQPIGTSVEDPFEQKLLEVGSRRLSALALPPAFQRPAEFSPFGGLLTPRLRNDAEARDLVATPLGHRPWDLDRDELRDRLPVKLLHRPGEYTREKADRTLKEGLNYIQLSPDAVLARGLDQVLAEISRHALVLDAQPNSIYLVYVEGKQIHELLKDATLFRSRIVEPADKISPTLGVRPLISRREATNPDIALLIGVVPGKRTGALLKELEQMKGVSEVAANPFEETGISLRAHYDAIAGLARLDAIRWIEEQREYILQNSENVPTIQAGNAHDTLGIRPFDDAGVDGGGLNAAGLPTGTRNNDGICGGAGTCTAPAAKIGLACTSDYDCNTSIVPPQIVGVIDNGISADTPSFSQTAIAVSTGAAPIGPVHRKVHSIIPIRDSGDDCDSALSGAASHGNIVASTIAAYPSALGFFANRSGMGGTGQPRNANMDGVARGARIILTDVADASRCTTNTLYEKGGNVDPGPSLLTRMNEIICPKDGSGVCAGIRGGRLESHLAVLPFGFPSNFSNLLFLADNGTYPAASVDLDTFAYNNRDFLMVLPVGNNGAFPGNARLGLSVPIIPDLFNGTVSDDDPNVPAPIQISAPATAKNIVSVGGSTDDCSTFFGSLDCENALVAYTSRGPATIQSLRGAPDVVAPQFDILANFSPLTAGVATFRSRDNDNIVPIEAQLSEGSFGTSFAAGYVTGAAAIIRDYFAQGMYPCGSRDPASRVRNVSWALVKAALAASADFEERGIGTLGEDANERFLRRTRALDVGAPGAFPVGIMRNSEQGYGRVVLTNVLPLSNWADSFQLHPLPGNHPIENPAAGLLVWDFLATGEPLLNNTTHLQQSHIFRVASPFTATRADNGGRVVTTGALRIALAWPDRPAAAGTGGPLITDLDLELESPGPDDCLGDGSPDDTTPTGLACPAGSSADNDFFDGNNYGPGSDDPVVSQWSIRHTATIGIEKHDRRNPLEAIHINPDPSNTGGFQQDPLYVGRWRVIVKRGCGGSNVGGVGTVSPPVCTTPGSILIFGTGANGEDANNNGRLDPGEDGVNGPANGLLDLPGQDYGLVVSGPVFLAEAAPPAGPPLFPTATITFDKNRYDCDDNAVLTIVEPGTIPAVPAKSTANTTVDVLNTAGAVFDTEVGIGFAATAAPGVTASVAIPVSLGAAGPDAILEADTDFTLVATYAPPGLKPAQAVARVNCNPDLVPGFFAANAGNNSQGTQFALDAGCDDDDFLDAGEVVIYGVAIVNRSRTDDYLGVTATLTPSGPGAGAIFVLDSPKVIGALPGSGLNGIFFHVLVDPTVANALAYAARVVTMTLTLSSVSMGHDISRQSYAFTHAINSDPEAFYYSTDLPGGGREVRDLNRNGVIDRPDRRDGDLGFILPREDVTFSNMDLPAGTSIGVASNKLGEDLNDNLAFSGTETDIIPDNILDGGILRSCRGGSQPGKACHAAGDCPGAGASCGPEVLWSFDTNNGGWRPFRHPGSTVSTPNGPNNPVWEYKTSGLCGYQTQADTTDGAGHLTGAGIWHTGDGNTATPAPASTNCDNFAQPYDVNTPPKMEMLTDVLESPIIAKVHQLTDARGFPYTVEFQRFGFNEDIQLYDGYAGGGINIDNNVDNDGTNSLLTQRVDTYYTRRAGGWPYGLFRFADQYFPGDGVDPLSGAVPPHNQQRTFGPLTGTLGTPGSRGFTGATEDTNPDSTTPIPTAPADFLPYPAPGGPLACVCDDGSACVSGTCGSGSPTFEANTDNGPVRNFDTSLVGYEGGFASLITGGLAAPENFYFFFPGPAGDRWQIGIGFWAIESPSGTTDFGVGVDDVVFEWKEWHPEDEAVLGHTPACGRFNTPGNPVGGQCATLTVDRTNLFECGTSLLVTVYDAKCIVIGPGNIVPAGGACTLPAQCGVGGVCSAALPSVTVQAASTSDHLTASALVPTKFFALLPVLGTPGLYSGLVPTSIFPSGIKLYTDTGDRAFAVYYADDLCDGDRSGLAGEDVFGFPPYDKDGNLIPDDIVTFTGSINCTLSTIPPTNMTLVAVQFHDLGAIPLAPGPSFQSAGQGDDDAFLDTGETGRVKVTLRNDGASLTDARIVLTSTDPDVACITSPVVAVGSFPAGSTITVGTIPGDPGFSLAQPGFQLVASNALENLGPPNPIPRIDMCVSVLANEIAGVSPPVCFSMLADVDLPGTPQVFTLGEDGSPNTADDGTVTENFDRDRNGDGNFTVADTFLAATSPGVFRGTCSSAPGTNCLTAADCPPDFDVAGPEVCYGGHYLQGSATGVGVNVVAGVPCGGYDDPAAGNPDCVLADNYYMDWHFHCKPGATNCPNDEELQPGSGPRVCNPGHTCSYDTPANGRKALSCPDAVNGPCNSLHMGAHFDPDDGQAGDSTHIRTLQAFVSAPINLAAFPRPGDLQLSYFHIARLMDDNGVGGGHNKSQCSDCADVQIQVDTNADPNVDAWGFWDKLAPFQNVYDHKVIAASAFAPYYCVFTPTDTGTAPPAPRTPAVHETMCYPQGAWSTCGSTTATTAAGVGDCAGPGVVDPSSRGVWVETAFNLSGYLGQRVRLRWIGSAWLFGPGPDSYFEVGAPWSATAHDDGWWLDDIRIAGAITTQISPVPDTKPRTGACPPTCNSAVGDGGTSVVLKVTDAAGTILDGTNTLTTRGQTIQVSAIGTTLPGGCSNGVPEFRFEKNGEVVQEWSALPIYRDAPEHSAHYHVLARCSTDISCTSLTGADIEVLVYSADGGDAIFGTRNSPSPPNYAIGVQYDRIGRTTTLSWNAPGHQKADVYRGTLTQGTSKGTLAYPKWTLNTTGGAAPGGSPATCVLAPVNLSNVSGTPATPGTNYTSGPLNQAADPDPGVGSARYYVAVANAPNGSSLNALGCANPDICLNAGWCTISGNPCNPGTCGAGTCVARTTFCATNDGIGDEGGCARHRVCSGGANNGLLCNVATVTTDCPGGSCPAPAAAPPGLCLNLTGVLIPPTLKPVGNPTPAPPLYTPDLSRVEITGCPNTTSNRRIVRQVPAGICQDQQAGACCYLGGCSVSTAEECVGQSMGPGTTCGPPNPCQGACCHGNGTCTETTQAACNGANDTYKGDGTQCASFKPTITAQPQNTTVCTGKDATFTITATGTGTLHYQWKKGVTNVGGDSATLELTGVPVGDDGAAITCEVKDACGTVTSDAATLRVFGDPACPDCATAAASTLTVTEAALATACTDYGLTVAPKAGTQVLVIETCIAGGPCHIEFRVTAGRDMESGPCIGNYTHVGGGGDPNVTPANFCAMADGFWNGGVANVNSGAFSIAGTSYGNTDGVELHEDAHVAEYVPLLNAELAVLLTRASMAPIPMDGNPPSQSCAQAKAARNAAITADVNTAYADATTAWAAQGEGVNGYMAEQPHYEGVARSICQWAKDQAAIDVDTCATCTGGALGVAYTDICGDGAVNDPGEACDGPDAAACPGACKPDCTCP